MKTLHVISHTHWDREWYLTFQEFRLKLVHLVDKLLDILDEDPAFRYFMLDGQTIVLEDYLQMRPEKEEVLRQHIQEGRILIGPWHILPDMFLISPEGHVRNLLQGAHTAEKFGPRMQVGYIPDPFGHPGQTPQILKGFGLKAASLWRGLSDQPTELWWESPDGSRILLAYLRDSYGNWANLPTTNPDSFAEQIRIAGESLAAHASVDHHLIMLGTDHMEPSPNTSAAIAHANEKLPHTTVIHSTLPIYVSQVREQIKNQSPAIPTIYGELRACDRMHLLPGVLSTRIWIKQRNHHSQILLEKWAEPFSVFAENFITKKNAWDEKPAEAMASNRLRHVAPILRQAWRLLMENHPHDSICGCSIDQVHDEMKPRFDQVDQIGEAITQQALQALSQAADTQSDDAFSAVVIFNPHNTPYQDLVEIELNMPENIAAFELMDENHQVIQHEFLGSSNETLANLVVGKNSLRDTIGAINEGRIAGAAIVQIQVSQQESTVTIDAVLDDHGKPNISAWRQAEAEIAKYEVDPGVTQFHVIAHTPRASKIQFISPEIPAFGWRVIWMRAVDPSESQKAVEIHPLLKPFVPLALRLAQKELVRSMISKWFTDGKQKPPYVIENDVFRVETSPSDGTLTVTDKRSQTVFTGLNRFVDGGDAGDEYNYSPPQNDSFQTPKIIAIKAFQAGVVQSLEIELALNIPTEISPERNSREKACVMIPIHSRISLKSGCQRIDIHTEINNLAKDHRLRVHFPAPFMVGQARHDGHFEVVQRSIGIPEKGKDWVEDPRPEVPQHAFTDISNGKSGLMIANCGLPEVEVIQKDDHSEIALTLLRCVGWLSRDDLPVRQGHAGPGLETPGGQMPGKWHFDYAVIPHKGRWQEACQLAYTFQTPLRAVETNIHVGHIPTQGSFITSTCDAFVISTVKETEDDQGWLVRGYNLTPEAIQVQLKPQRNFKLAKVINLAEEEIYTLALEADGSITFPVSGHQVVSIMFSE